EIDGPVPRRVQPAADIVELFSPRRLREPVPCGPGNVNDPAPAGGQPALNILQFFGPRGVDNPLPGCPGNVDGPRPAFFKCLPDGLDVVVPGVGRRRADAQPVVLPRRPKQRDGTDGDGGIDDDRRKDYAQQPAECTQQSTRLRNGRTKDTQNTNGAQHGPNYNRPPHRVGAQGRVDILDSTDDVLEQAHARLHRRQEPHGYFASSG